MDDEIDRMIAEGSPVSPEHDEAVAGNVSGFPSDYADPAQPQEPYDWKAEGDYPRIEVPYAE